jgi:hypothetical protein
VSAGDDRAITAFREDLTQSPAQLQIAAIGPRLRSNPRDLSLSEHSGHRNAVAVVLGRLRLTASVSAPACRMVGKIRSVIGYLADVGSGRVVELG